MLVAGATTLLHALLGADESLVSLDDTAAASAAHRCGKAAGAHRFADAVPEEPRALEGDLQGAVKLVRGNPLLTGCNEVDRLQPDAKRNMAILEDSADFDGERLFAGVALVSANTGAFPAQLVHAMSFTAFRADGAVRPNAGFNPGIGGFFAMEMIVGKNGHDTLLFESNVGHSGRYVKYNMPLGMLSDTPLGEWATTKAQGEARAA